MAFETISWDLDGTPNNENRDSGGGQRRSSIDDSGTSTYLIFNETKHSHVEFSLLALTDFDLGILKQYRGT